MRKPKAPVKTKAATKTKRVVVSITRKKPKVVETLPKLVIPGGRLKRAPSPANGPDGVDIEMEVAGKSSH